MKTTILPALLLLFSLSGCSSTGGENTILGSWKGANIDEAIRQWGVPARQATLSDGSAVYEWPDERDYALPTMMTGTATQAGNTTQIQAVTSPGGSFTGRCVRSLTVDPQGRVVDAAARGDNCCVMAVAGYCKSLIRQPKP